MKAENAISKGIDGSGNENSGTEVEFCEMRLGSFAHNHVCAGVVRVTFFPASAWYEPPSRYRMFESRQVEFPYVACALRGA